MPLLTAPQQDHEHCPCSHVLQTLHLQPVQPARREQGSPSCELTCAGARVQVKSWRDLEEEEKKEGETETSAWMKHHTQACCNCGAHVQRSDGCNHMQCTVCSQHFCYICGRDWCAPSFARAAPSNRNSNLQQRGQCWRDCDTHAWELSAHACTVQGDAWAADRRLLRVHARPRERRRAAALAAAGRGEHGGVDAAFGVEVLLHAAGRIHAPLLRADG